MFNFMDFGMPPMFGNSGRSSMRASATPAHRRLDTWGFFDPQPEPVYHYQPSRQTVNSRQPFYNDYNDDDEDEYTGYEHLRRTPRSSYGGYGRPQYYRTAADDEDVEPRTASTARQTARPQSYRHKQHPEPYRQHHYANNVASDEEDGDEEVQRPAAQAHKQPQASPQQRGSFYNQPRSEPFCRGSQTTRHKPEPNVFKSQLGEHMSSKTPQKAQTSTTKPQRKSAANTENVNPNTANKAPHNTPHHQKASAKTPKAAQAAQPASSQYVADKLIITQDKGDVVVIEDVTPAQPKRNPALELSRGVIIEEVNPSQI